jgi:hypothetical protein
MTIVYQGIRRKTTDVLDDYGQCQYLQNVRLKRVGELARRAGLGKSTMAQQAGPVQFMIGAWSNVPFIVNGTGGDVFGEEDPLAYWTAATMRKVIGEVGQPANPVINSVSASPPSPQGYTAGVVVFTPNITYDGLSGALSYNWVQTVGPAAPNPPFSADPTWSTNFDGFCIPGLYSFTLTITTALGGFGAGPFPFSFTVS